ncbi:MAG: DUF3021 domain-containing protein [Oscillospiraceae bacterium]|nr:DUF3021 domain-containing protein [Oscillospiraceae bacterium]
MKNKIIKRAVMGFFIGIAIGQMICVLISLMSGNGQFIICTPEFTELIGNEAAAAAIQTLLCAVMGSGYSAASVIWESDNLSIAAQSGICFAIYAVFLLPVAYFTNWMEHSVSGVLGYIGIFAASFVFVWVIQYFSWKKKLNAINQKLIG